LQHLDEVGHLGLHLIFSTEDMRIVLREGTHAHQTMQRAGRLVAVAGTELGQRMAGRGRSAGRG
jgi:hypothetical protein